MVLPYLSFLPYFPLSQSPFHNPNPKPEAHCLSHAPYLQPALSFGTCDHHLWMLHAACPSVSLATVVGVKARENFKAYCYESLYK